MTNQSIPETFIRRSLRRGFTLIEMMVAIAISSFVVAGLYGLFTVQTSQFMFQDLQMEMHQNLRFGTDVLSRSIRMAGFNTNGFVTGVMGSDGTSGSSVDASTLPAIIAWDNDGANGTDAITVVYGDPSTVMATHYNVMEPYTTESITFQANSQDNNEKLQQITAGDLLLCHDFASMSGTQTYLWEVSLDADTTSGVVEVYQNDTNYSDYINLFGSDTNLSPIMNCAKGQVLTFYVDDSDDGTGPGTEDHPVLMMDMNFNWPNDDDIPLVDNVEDLQIEYCMDGGTGVDCNTDAQWRNEFTTDRADEVWGVRISLLIRSSREESRGIYKNSRAKYSLGNNTITSTDTDGYYRQPLVTEVATRNLRAL
ncbi:MAG: prepilin-type N-terminal cleavage/methylation domain-containing protein [Myxococcota bacterium]|jgi:prepilin-type N-terminal cleavage/methylation domain-containing protein